MRRLVFTALLAALLCILAPLSIPFGAVPVSLGLFGVCLVSLLSDRRCALMAVLLYVALGAVGLPVFAGFSGGAQVLSGPTGGYLLGYVPMAALICGFCDGKRTLPRMALGMGVGLAVCYVLGAVWYAISADVSLIAAAAVGILPFVIFDVIKLVAAGTLALILGRRIDRIADVEGRRQDR